MALHFNLHPAQEEVFDSPARFKVVVAGRRFGKTYLSAITLILEALKDVNDAGKDLMGKEVYYIAPTFTQGKEIMWDLIKSLAKMEKEGGVIAAAYENTATVRLVNGRTISIKGADRPDSLRGVGLSYCVMDEYAMMKPDVWEKIIRPALSDVAGGALFIGTPEGKNHFYELYQKALSDASAYANWQAFNYESLANPTLDKAEIAEAIAGMSVGAARQEFGASFNSGGSDYFDESWWTYGRRPAEGNYIIAIDLAGFADSGSLKRGVLKIKDEHSICVAKCNEDGWFIEEIISGQWDVRKTAVLIAKAYFDYRPIKLGIEKGALKNAVGPYLDDEMKRNQRYFIPYDLTHGGQHKSDRILWALQGRLRKGRLTLNQEESNNPDSLQWQRKLIEQANDFPSSLAHDDLLDSLAYIDQLHITNYNQTGEIDTFEAYDLVSGI